jgi:hypothetical protein
MRLEQFVDEGIARRYEYADRTVFAADFGPDSATSVEVVDDTVIVVTGDGRQRELELPAGEARAFNRNGVVTVEVRQ